MTKPPFVSRSMARRIAAQKGEPAPRFCSCPGCDTPVHDIGYKDAALLCGPCALYWLANGTTGCTHGKLPLSALAAACTCRRPGKGNGLNCSAEPCSCACHG